MVKLGSRGLLNRIQALFQNVNVLMKADENSTIVVDAESFVLPFDFIPVMNVILSKNLIIEYNNPTLQSITYIQQMGFPVGSRPALCSRKGTGTYLPIAVIPCYNLDHAERDSEIQDLVNVYIDLIHTFEPEAITKEFLFTILMEMIDNAGDHSNASFILLCAQYLKKNNEIHICLCDDGVGLLGSLSPVFPNLKDDSEALREVITKQLSSRNPHSYYEPGQGIRTTKNLLSNTETNGTFLLISGNALYYKDSQIEKYFNLQHSRWNGTIVNMVVKIPSIVDIYKYV